MICLSTVVIWRFFPGVMILWMDATISFSAFVFRSAVLAVCAISTAFANKKSFSTYISLYPFLLWRPHIYNIQVGFEITVTSQTPQLHNVVCHRLSKVSDCNNGNGIDQQRLVAWAQSAAWMLALTHHKTSPLQDQVPRGFVVRHSSWPQSHWVQKALFPLVILLALKKMVPVQWMPRLNQCQV